MKWSDISWFEWGSDLAVTGSNQPKVCKNIIRLPRNEENPQWSEAVNWANIDIRLTVGDCDAEETLAHELDKINKVLIELEAKIESEQTDSPSCDDLQGAAPAEASLSPQSTAAANEEN
jgi:hypothetical protein